MLQAILKNTRNTSSRIEALADELGAPLKNISAEIEQLTKENLVQVGKEGVVETTPRQRLKMSFDIIKSGGDVEKVCRYLTWQEFEDASAQILDESGYRVLHRYRFRSEGRRWEIDLLAFKKPMILCFDCKHWRGGGKRSALMKAIEAQAKRVEAFAQSAKVNRIKLGLSDWNKATLLPVMIVLLDLPLIHGGVPSVPVFRLGDFLYELPAALDSLSSVRLSLNE